MRWPPEALDWLGVESDDSEGDVIAIRVGTPAGVVALMGEVAIEGRTLIVRGVHIEGSGPNSVGATNLRAIAELVLERIDCDEARVEGAIRTTGANPGHRPRVLRFTGRPRDPTG